MKVFGLFPRGIHQEINLFEEYLTGMGLNPSVFAKVSLSVKFDQKKVLLIFRDCSRDCFSQWKAALWNLLWLGGGKRKCFLISFVVAPQKCNCSSGKSYTVLSPEKFNFISSKKKCGLWKSSNKNCHKPRTKADVPMLVLHRKRVPIELKSALMCLAGRSRISENKRRERTCLICGWKSPCQNEEKYWQTFKKFCLLRILPVLRCVPVHFGSVVSTSLCSCSYLQNYTRLHPEVPVLNPLPRVKRLLDRHRQYQIVSSSPLISKEGNFNCLLTWSPAPNFPKAGHSGRRGGRCCLPRQIVVCRQNLCFTVSASTTTALSWKIICFICVFMLQQERNSWFLRSWIFLRQARRTTNRAWKNLAWPTPSVSFFPHIFVTSGVRQSSLQFLWPFCSPTNCTIQKFVLHRLGGQHEREPTRRCCVSRMANSTQTSFGFRCDEYVGQFLHVNFFFKDSEKTKHCNFLCV